MWDLLKSRDASKTLPSGLTSYDLLKTLAIALMAIDHVGFYVFDNEPWMRVLGRLCVPIWFFLIGYARSTEVPKVVFIGAALIAAGNMLAGEYLLPLCILVTLMLGRVYKDAWMRAVIKGGEAYAGLFFFFLIGILPTEILFEYGTMGFFFVIMGAVARLKQDNPVLYTEKMHKESRLFVGAAFALFVFSEALRFPELSWWHLGALVAGMIGICFMLAHFRGQELPAWDQKIPAPIVRLLQFTGRHTLWIYVGHLLVLKTYAVLYISEKFPLLEWDYIRPGFTGFIRSVLNM